MRKCPLSLRVTKSQNDFKLNQDAAVMVYQLWAQTRHYCLAH